MLGLFGLIVLVLMIATTGAPRLAFSGLFIGIVFVGFCVMMLRGLIGFGRWLMQMPEAPRRNFGTGGPGRQRSLSAGRACADPRCGKVNPAEAKYCAQCGRPLGQAA